jgi:hypothetical protein
VRGYACGQAGECDSSQAAPKRVSGAEVLVGPKRTSDSGNEKIEGK